MVGSSGDIGVRQPPYARRSTGGRLRAALQDRRAPCEESAMGTSTRFAVGVHLLTALAASPGKAVRSEDIADSANTNAVVVRRLFSLMTSAGLIRTRLGPGGGFELARPAGDITCVMSSRRWRATSFLPSIARRPAHPVLWAPISFRFCARRRRRRSRLSRRSFRAQRLPISPAPCLPEATARGAGKRSPL